MNDEMQLSASETLAGMTATASASTLALADLLIGLRERVPLSEAQIARATGADEQIVGAWLQRRVAPIGLHAERVAELAAFAEDMARNIEGQGSRDGWTGVWTCSMALTHWMRLQPDATSG